MRRTPHAWQIALITHNSLNSENCSHLREAAVSVHHFLRTAPIQALIDRRYIFKLGTFQPWEVFVDWLRLLFQSCSFQFLSVQYCFPFIIDTACRSTSNANPYNSGGLTLRLKGRICPETSPILMTYLKGLCTSVPVYSAECTDRYIFSKRWGKVWNSWEAISHVMNEEQCVGMNKSWWKRVKVWEKGNRFLVRRPSFALSLIWR